MTRDARPALYQNDNMSTRLRVQDNGNDGAIMITLNHHETRKPTYYFMTEEQKKEFIAWLAQ